MTARSRKHMQNAASMFRSRTGICVEPIVTASDIIEYLNRRGLEEHAAKIQAHLNVYGIRDVRR